MESRHSSEEVRLKTIKKRIIATRNITIAEANETSGNTNIKE